MAGKRVETPVTLTSDVSKLLKCFREINLSGESDFVTAVNISMLLLKHRQNKNQKLRILMFAVSPVKNSVDEMVLLGKKLKKNNVAIDIISFGNVDVNHEPLSQLQSNANNSNNSNLLEISPDQFVIDSLFISPILNDNMYDNPENIGVENVVNNNNNNNNNGSNVNAGGNNQGGVSQFERDINLAIQQSIQEEERRKKAADEGTENINEKNLSKDKPAENTEIKNNDNNDNNEEEDLAAELEKARLMSIQEHENNVKEEKEKEKKLKEEIIDDEDFIKGVMDEIGIPEDENKNKENKDDKDKKDK